MNEDRMFMVAMDLGTVKLVPDCKILPDGSMLLGGYSIRYDEHGRFVSRTETTWNLRVTES